MANAKTNVEIMLPFADNEKHVVSVTPTATKSSVITPVVVKGTNTIPSKAETIFTLPTTTTNTASKPTTTNIGFENSGLTRDEYDSKVRSNYTQTDAFKYSDSYGSTLKKDAEEKQAAYLALGGTDALDPEEAEAARLAAKEAQKKYDDWTTEKFQYNQSQALDRLSDDELAYVQTIVDANDAIELYNTAAAYTGGYSRYADVGISEDFDAKKKATDELKNLGYTQEQIDAFVEYQKYRSDAEKAAAEEEKLQQEATEHPVAADLGAFAANLGSGIGALTGFARALTSTDPYAPLNVNSSDFAGVRVAQTVREQRAENIENSVDNELLGKTLSFLYGVGGSIADSATVVATMGPASVYFLGTTAAANAAKDITERGGSVKQAALGAAAAGLIEILTEKVSVENLLNSVGNTKTLTAVLKQAGVEATEEISADVLNTVSDSIIMRGKSNYNIAVAQYMMQGLSEEEAQRQALIDIAKQTALSGAAGAISGGVMSGGLNVANSLFNNVRAAGTDTQATVDTETAEGAQGEITPDTAQAATTQETEASVLQTAVDAYKESGTVTNETARRIIASPEAVAELGIDLSNMTASQQRLAVKGAIAEFVQGNTETHTQTTAQTETPTQTQTEATTQEQTAAAQTEAATQAAPTQAQSATTAQTVPTDINGNPEGHGAMSNPYVQRRAQSRTTSLYTNEADVPDEYSQPIEHDVVSNAQSMGWATERVQQGVNEEIEALRAKTEWSGEDVDTAGIILEQLRSKARESSDDADWQAYRDMRKLYSDRVGEAGRALQATQKWVVTDGNSIIDKADEALEQAEKAPKNIRDTISRYANRFDTATAEQSAADFVQIIRDAAITRRTAGMYSESFGKEIEWALERLWFSGSDANYDFLRQMAGQSIVNIASDYIPAAAVDKIHSYRRLSMLSKASTTLRNLIGTGSFIGLDLMSNDLSVPLDMLLAEVTGTRSVGVEKVGKAAVESSLDALAKSVAQVGLDVDATGSNSSYETTNGRTYKMTGGLFSRFMSTWEKYSNYAMSSTDQLYQGFSQGMTQEAIDELIQQQFVADDTLETAAQDAALYRAFNDESAPAKLLLDIRRAIDRRTPNLKLGTAIAPFTKIAANLAARNFDYSPVGMVKGLAEVLNVVVNTKKGNTVTAAQQSKAVRDVGRGFTGSAMIALAAYAALKGVLHVEGMDEDDDNKNRNAVMAAQGVDGTQLNVSALLRGLKSESTDWRDDDKLLSVGYLQPINFLLTVGAYLAADMKDGLQLSDIINSTTRGFVESLAQLPLVDAFVDAVESAQYSESRADQVWDALASFGGSTVASFIPNAVRGIAQGIDTTQRDIYGTDNKLEQVLNQIKSALPVLRNTIPAKTDSYGNELTYGDSAWQNFLNSNLRAGNKTRFQTTELETELNRLYNATESASAYPAREAPSSITYDKQKYVLDDEQKSIYQKAYGDAYESLSNDFFGSDIYHMLDDKEKIDIYSQIKEYAAESAKAAVLGAEDLKESVAEISDLSDPAMYIAANRMFNDANNDNDWSDIERLFANGGVPDDVAEALGTDYSKNKAVYEAGVDLAEYHDMKSAFNEGYKAATDDDESTVPDYSAIDAVIDTYNALQEEQRSVIDDVLNAMTLSKAAGAAEVGINSETWFDIYNTYKDIDESDANATDKQTELEHTIDIMLGLSSAQKQYAKDILTYFTIVPAEASKYNALKASGLSPERAEYVYELAQRAPTIYSTDSAGNSERAVWIARCSMNDDEKLAALSTYFSDGTEGSTYKKCVNALEQGISIEKFTRFWYEYNNGNKNTNYSKYSSLKNYLYAWGQNNGYSSQEVSTLYQLLK